MTAEEHNKTLATLYLIYGAMHGLTMLGLLLLAAVGLGGYFLVQRLLPYADQPITHVSVEGDLHYASREAVAASPARQRFAPCWSRWFLASAVSVKTNR